MISLWMCSSLILPVGRDGSATLCPKKEYRYMGSAIVKSSVVTEYGAMEEFPGGTS